MVKILRNGNAALFAALFAGALLVPEGVQAQGSFYAGGLRSYGYASYPFDDSYDYPFGYGEYAEYGPWVHRGGDNFGCELMLRRVRTASGRRWRTVRTCY